MKSIAGMLILVAFAGAAVHAADASKSVALVRAMRTDEISVATLKFAFLKGEMARKYGKTNDRCVRRVPHTDFTAPWAKVVEGVLTPKEIDESLAFYQSDAGVKFVEGLLRRMRDRQGEDTVLPQIAGKEELSAAQTAAISGFLSSDLGRKVTGKELVMSPAAMNLGTEIGKQIAQLCGGK